MAELCEVKCPGCREVILKCPDKFDQAVVDIVAFHYADNCASRTKDK